MMSGATMIWQTQELLHSKHSQFVPALLMLLAGSLTVHRHMTTDDNEFGDHLRKFYSLIFLQMVPLVILECKIMSCTDPVGLFCKFGAPVTMMHALFLGVRCLCAYQGIISVLGLLGALITLYVGFHQSLSLRGVLEQHAVWRLALLACVGAAFTEGFECIFSLTPPHDTAELFWATVKTAGNYLELTAFVPAVWMVYREQTTAERYEVDGLDAHNIRMKRSATAFFLFLVGVYILEDLYSGYESYSIEPLALVAHIAHFCLLLDFALYILAHIYNPEKLVGELAKWLPFDRSCSV